MFIYSYQQHDHLLPGNDRMLVIGSSALAKNHGHLKSSRLAADTLIFNFPLNHPRLWRQMEHSLSGARYSIILFMWPPLHLSPANGRLMEKPPEGGGPMESAEDMLCRLFAFLRKQTRRLILLSSPPSDYGSARHPYAEEPGVLEAWNALLRTLADRLNLPFIDFCGDMLQCRPLPGSGEEDFPEAYRNLGKQVLRRLPFGQTWVRRRSGKIHRLLEKRRKRRKERMLARWRTLAASSLPGAVLSDHHGFMQGRRYIDPFHFSPPDRAYQAGKTAGLLLPLLSARQEPPKEQECPKSRPEP